MAKGEDEKVLFSIEEILACSPFCLIKELQNE
jgi:hypothetical protein